MIENETELRSTLSVNNKRMGDIVLNAMKQHRPTTIQEDNEFSRLDSENKEIRQKLGEPLEKYETRILEHPEVPDPEVEPELRESPEEPEVTRAKAKAELEAWRAERAKHQETPSPDGQIHFPPAEIRRNADGGVLDSTVHEPWIDQRTGEPIKVLGREERMADLVQIPRDYEPLSLGKYIKGIATGEWAGASAEHRAMNEGSGGAGQFLVPSPLAANIIDKMRNKSVLFQAGALTVPMSSQTLAIARIAADPTPMWHSEAGTITPSDMTFERVTFTAQVLAAICQLSVEVFEDCNIDQIVSDTLAKVLSLELDRAGLRGSGTAPELKGIRFQTGVNIDTTTFTTNGSVISASAPAGAPAHIWLGKMIAAMWTVNENPNAVIWHPRTAGEMDQLVDSTGQPLRELPSESKLVKLQTASIPINLTQGTSNDASEATLGDFSAAMVGMRTGLTLEVSRLGNIGATSLFSTMQVGIRAYLRADFQLARPAAFRVVAGIR